MEVTNLCINKSRASCLSIANVHFQLIEFNVSNRYVSTTLQEINIGFYAYNVFSVTEKCDSYLHISNVSGFYAKYGVDGMYIIYRVVCKVFEKSSTKNKVKYLGHFSTKSNVVFLNEREMFKVLFWFQINNMSDFLKTKIQVVVLMAKHESPVMIIREL